MKESSIERYLTEMTKAKGGLSIKLGGYVGIPDRLIILPGPVLMFVELKTLTGRLSPLQCKWAAMLTKLGCHYMVIRSKADVVDFMFNYETEKNVK